MPQPSSDGELRTKLTAIVHDINAEGMKEMGKEMGRAQKELSGKADSGKMASFVNDL